MGRIRYGIHANRDEHFGIAPAEMMASGCIVFVHNSGGQVEIIGRDLRLCYQTDKAAVEKILGIVNSATLQAAILDSPAPRRTMFRTAAFMGGLRNLARRPYDGIGQHAERARGAVAITPCVSSDAVR